MTRESGQENITAKNKSVFDQRARATFNQINLEQSQSFLERYSSIFLMGSEYWQGNLLQQVTRKKLETQLAEKEKFSEKIKNLSNRISLELNKIKHQVSPFEVLSIPSIKIDVENIEEHFQALEDYYEVTIAENTSNTSQRYNRLKYLENEIQSFQDAQDEQIRYTQLSLSNTVSLIDVSPKNPIFQQLAQASHEEDAIQEKAIKLAKNQTSAIQKWLNRDDDFNGEDKNSLAGIKVTTKTDDLQKDVQYFIDHPIKNFFWHVPSLIRSSLRNLFPFWHDRQLVIYSIFSTLYQLHGRQQVEQIFNAIYSNKGEPDPRLEILDQIKSDNLKQYLRDELFFYELLKLCQRVDDRNIQKQLAAELRLLGRHEIGTSCALNLGENLSPSAEFKAHLTLVAGIIDPDNMPGSGLSQFAQATFRRTAAGIVAIGMLGAVFAAGIKWLGLTAIVSSPWGIAALGLVSFIAIAACWVHFNTNNNSLMLLGVFLRDDIIEAKQPSWKKWLARSSFLLCIIAGFVIGGVISYFGTLQTLIFLGSLFAGISTALFATTFPTLLTIFTVIALSVAVVATIAEISLLFREFYKLVKENSFWNFMLKMREIYFDAFIAVWHAADYKARISQLLACTTRAVITALVVLATLILVIVATAAAFSTFNDKLMDASRIMQWLGRSVEIAETAATIATWATTAVLAIFNVSILITTINYVSALVYNTAIISLLPVVWVLGLIASPMTQLGLRQYLVQSKEAISKQFNEMFGGIESPLDNPFIFLSIAVFLENIIKVIGVITKAAGRALIFPELPGVFQTPFKLLNEIVAIISNFWLSFTVNILAVDLPKTGKPLPPLPDPELKLPTDLEKTPDQQENKPVHSDSKKENSTTNSIFRNSTKFLLFNEPQITKISKCQTSAEMSL